MRRLARSSSLCRSSPTRSASADTRIIPTELPIGKLMGDDFVAAGDATPEEQYRWLQLIEQYWLGPRGNQCSYTLKYNPKKVAFEEFVNSHKTMHFLLNRSVNGQKFKSYVRELKANCVELPPGVETFDKTVIRRFK